MNVDENLLNFTRSSGFGHVEYIDLSARASDLP